MEEDWAHNVDEYNITTEENVKSGARYVEVNQ